MNVIPFKGLESLRETVLNFLHEVSEARRSSLTFVRYSDNASCKKKRRAHNNRTDDCTLHLNKYEFMKVVLLQFPWNMRTGQREGNWRNFRSKLLLICEPQDVKGS
jgi:hypothetical protein